MREILRLTLVLTLICGVSAGLLSLARATLGPRIDLQNDLNVRGPALERLFERPAAELLSRKIRLQDQARELSIVYVEREGEVVALAVEAEGEGGYGGPVSLLVGVDLRQESLVGVEVIAHNETPGVGARIVEEGFRRQWVGLPATTPVALRNEGGGIDAITGATYSSRAMVDGTNQVVDLLARRQAEILDAVQAHRER